MSKAVFGVVLLVAAIAVPFIAPAIATAVFGTATALGVAAITAGLEIGLSLLSSAVLGQPGLPQGLKTNPIQRLYATLETTTPRKIVFGDTAAPADVRYQTYTGADQEYYHQVIATASHYVGGYYEAWLDNEKAATLSLAGGPVATPLGRYVGYFDSGGGRFLGTPGAGLAIDSTWTVHCSLTGCAWVHFQYKLTGPDSSTPSPFQGGVSNRLTIRQKGAYLYDPRLDGTVAGGSGAMRADVQSTWYAPAWDPNRCRNPALALLFYLIGWREPSSGKLMLGMGIPPARIDLPSFITAANICDEAVSLKGGGTEPRYRCDGVVSEGDDRKAVIDSLCACMNAMLRDASGKISVQVLRDDLGTPVLDLGPNDILGGEDWVQTPPLSSYYNVVRGRYVDPSDKALYQLSAYPEQKVASPDGIARILTLDFPLVQSATQAQRLAKLRLMRTQYQGRYSATFGPRAWAASIGTIVRLTHPGLNFTSKLFRVVEQRIGRNGQVTMALLEESSSIYAWNAATDEQTPVSAGNPIVVDPTNNPTLPVPDITVVLSNSYPAGLFVTAIDAGSSATIQLHGGSPGDDFAIDYGTSPRQLVTVPAANLTGFAYSTGFYLYADVDDILDATPVYGATTDYGSALNSATHPKRIFLNRFITTPAAGGAATTPTGIGGSYGGGFDRGDGSGTVAYP